ncbi:MAG: hypothetical protein JWN44_3682 [Myxococcales bacterium]|nr:hypothetical protein [Myxococcales bacterium]
MIGALLAVGGAAGAGWALRAASSRRRPLDVVAALLAPLFVIGFIVGVVTLFVPRFLH